MNEMETVSRLRSEVIDELKRRFVGRDEVIDLIALAVVAGEHLFLLGAPGTDRHVFLLWRIFCGYGAIPCRCQKRVSDQLF